MKSRSQRGKKKKTINLELDIQRNYCLGKRVKSKIFQEYLLWCSGLRIQLQWLSGRGLGLFDPWPGAVVKGYGVATTVALVAAAAQIQPLAWKLPYATGVAIKKKKKDCTSRGSKVDEERKRNGEK